MPTLDDLKAKYAQEEKDLKAKYALKLKQAKALEAKKERRLAVEARKLETHTKILIGGYMLAEWRKNKKVDVLKRLLLDTKREQDKTALNALIAEITNAAKAPEQA